jgi:transcription elongation factor Elf1
MHACISHRVLAFETLHCQMLSSSCLLDFAKKIHSPSCGKTGPIFWVSLSKFGKQVEEEDKKVEEAG